jgi:hypothetical protein
MRQEQERVSAANDNGDSLTIGDDSAYMMAFANEMMTARFQGQLKREECSDEIRYTLRQCQAMEEFPDLKVDPYFPRSKYSHDQNGLHCKTANHDIGKKMKTAAVTSISCFSTTYKPLSGKMRLIRNGTTLLTTKNSN